MGGVAGGRKVQAGGIEGWAQKRGALTKETDRAHVGYRAGSSSARLQGLRVGGAYALRQGFLEKDLSSCSHSSCRLPLPRQVQPRATLVLTLLTKFGVMAVPVG